MVTTLSRAPARRRTVESRAVRWTRRAFAGMFVAGAAGHAAFASLSPEIYEGCSTAALGCVDCKKRVAQAVADYLAPLREKRRELEADPGRVDEIIRDGDERARVRAVETMERVRDAMHVGKTR